MKAVTRFETEDGRFFETKAQALNHERLLVMERWYDDNKLYGQFEGCRIEWGYFLGWLQEHKEKVAEILGVIESE